MKRFVEALVPAVNEETRTLTTKIEALWQASADMESFQHLECLDARLQDLQKLTQASIEAEFASMGDDDATEALVDSYYVRVQTPDMSLPHMLSLQAAVVAVREQVAKRRRVA